MNPCRSPNLRTGVFLSCLCGSERNLLAELCIAHFLSCLCGSELKGDDEAEEAMFLSCLCGSERG